MSQENVESLKALYKQWARGDWADTSIFDPYVVAVLPDPTPRPHYGLEALAAYMGRFLAGWDNMRMEATNYRDGGSSMANPKPSRPPGCGSRALTSPLQSHWASLVAGNRVPRTRQAGLKPQRRGRDSSQVPGFAGRAPVSTKEEP